ncbi:DNA polymerase-3 subunit alpha [Pilibacter termitis]|uniref:DNA polymerase III PolC-type n=1 Tax=Pilibacter termitis TaxID=263852 RepID=A0A1T4R5R3_9ENTE|nr:PolC-type DNA polymerase III [Pilibacter termitis]SKA11237.1 DNA polymerase-3 subunit alpha [Pilibacter termitis]
MSQERELFEKLLQQIQLSQEFQQQMFGFGGELKRVDVFPKTRVWRFTLFFEQLLPAKTMSQFVEKLHFAFQNIATVELFVEVEKTSFDEQLLNDYWQMILERISIASPMVKASLKRTKLSFQEERVVLFLTNVAVEKMLQETYCQAFERSFQQLGFPKFSILTQIDEEKAEILLQSHQDRKEELEQLEAIYAQEKMAEAEQRVAEQVVEEKTEEPLPEITGSIQLGRPISDHEEITPMKEINHPADNVVFEGFIFKSEIKTTRTGKKILEFEITDYTSSFQVSKFGFNKMDEAIFEAINSKVSLKKGTGLWVRIKGKVEDNEYARDLIVGKLYSLMEIPHGDRMDYAEEKRVELHLHTNMSAMDAIDTASSYVAQAKKWGHKALAITDHGVAQSYPEAHSAKGDDFKIIYGFEAYVVDEEVPIAYNNAPVDLNEATYVVFDIETTSLSAVYGKIIQIAGVKMYKGNVIEEFEEFIDPGFPLSRFTKQLTGITDDDVRGSKPLEQVLQEFQAFCKDTVLVAHNGTFDVGYMNVNYTRFGMSEIQEPWFDTLEFARNLYPEMKRFGLSQLTKKFKIDLGDNHHNAIFDSQATGHLAWIFVKEAIEKYGVVTHDELNEKVSAPDAFKRARPFHATVYAKNQEGLRDLFRVVSDANTKYFYEVPRVPRALLEEFRESLILGSACRSGEVFTAMAEKSYEEAKKKAQFYDFLEIMPPSVYAPQVFDQLFTDDELKEVLSNIIKLGNELHKPVVATGNVHYINKEESLYREILIRQLGWKNELNRPKFRDDQNSLPPMPEVHFRTTDEMLADFAFLGEEVAHEVVVKNSNLVADWFGEITPVRDDLYTPKMENVEENLTRLTYETATSMYGEELPEIVEKRIEKELFSIIGNGFAVIYWISRELVHRSNERGYLVGSRGSVGSSFVATMTGITEVNPLPPHYVCLNCHYHEFYDDGTYGSGFDMPEKECPKCGNRLHKDGQDIPFETFLGFHGDKVPDIDLNFSGEDQPSAHLDCRDIFGEDYAFRAGTISGVQEKTAFGFVKAWERDNALSLRNAEVDRLSIGTTGIKRTTGQHPGGIIVIPGYMDVYDFTPVQYPADDVNATWRTTHFDFHSIHDNVLKLDILGHVDPTVIRMLQDLSGIDPKTIPADDPEVMKIFSGPEVLGVTPEQIYSKTGTFGVPEFGTGFVRGMLEETHPSTFAELLQISGLSHGTDVWLGNAQELIKAGTANLASVIGCRDDIMVYLMHRGLESGLAFKIMESVRKGKGIPDEWQEEMRAKDVPAWYIDSCLKIKYMFPKAHAAAYVLMALRVAYFKVHFPIIYYCAYFSHRADDFDLKAMADGLPAVKARMEEIREKVKINEASNKEKNMYTVLELVNEMLERGMEFSTIDLYKSDWHDFKIDGNKLIPPFRAVDGLGANVAKSIMVAREEGEFLSKQELKNRTALSTTLLEKLDELGSLKGMPEENQLSLFEL